MKIKMDKKQIMIVPFTLPVHLSSMHWPWY